MLEILHTLGINTPDIIAQMLVFGIVYFILSKYAFGPVTALLEERRRRIAEGEDNLKKIRENLAAAEATAEEVKAKANAEADRMINEARDTAAAAGEAERQKVAVEANAMITKAREGTELERARILGELKRDFGRLVLDATARATGKVLTPEDHARLNTEALSQITNN